MKGGAYMAHIHEVKDAETHFIINATTREISNADELPALVQNDHNSEVFSFVVDRFVDGHDMATCNKTRVHYINIDSSTKEQHADVYEVKDLHVDENDETKVVCTWLISRYATQYAGSLNFVLQYACENDGIFDYAWNTAIFKSITVKNGINNAEQIIADYSDILEQWKQELESSIKKNSVASFERKFEDIIPVEYDDPVLVTVTGNDYTDKVAVKIAELPENTTPLEMVKNFVGYIYNEVETRFDDKKNLSIEFRAKLEIIQFGADNSGAMFCRDGIPFFTVTSADNLEHIVNETAYDKEQSYHFVFPEKGVYANITGREPDENGVMKYKSFDKILFRDVQQIDEKLIPDKYATIDEIPKNPDVLEGFTYENEKLLYNGKPIEGSGEIADGAVDKFKLETSLKEEIETAYNNANDAKETAVIAKGSADAAFEAFDMFYNNELFNLIEIQDESSKYNNLLATNAVLKIEKELDKVEIFGKTVTEEFIPEVESGFYAPDNANKAGLTPSNWHSTIYAQAGEIYAITTRCGSALRAYLITDKDGNILDMSEKEEWDTRHNYDIEVKIESDCVLYINGIGSDSISVRRTKTINKFIVNKLTGKTISCNGDSIMYGAGYTGGFAKIIADRNGMALTNNAVSGGTLASETYRNGVARHWISSSFENLPMTDYIIFNGGANDRSLSGNGQGEPAVGAISDGYDAALDLTTTLGGLEHCCKLLRTKYVTCKSGFIFPHRIWGYVDYWDTIYRVKMKEVLEKWGVPYLDLSDIAPPLNRIDTLKTAYTNNGDGWHPNELGYKLFYCDVVEEWLKTL